MDDANNNEAAGLWIGRLAGILRIREPLGWTKRLVLGLIPIIALIGLWTYATWGVVEERWISITILPSPWEVITSFPSLWYDRELSRSALVSARRIVLGFGVALAIALPIGVLMGAFSKVKALFEPLTLFGGYLPIPALVPLTMSLFGIDETQKVMFLAIAFLVYLLPLFVKALDDVDEIFLQTAYTLGANRLQAVWHVLLGIAWPRIFLSMRMGFGIGWSYIILAELVAAERGLGHIISIAQRRGPHEHIYLTLVVIVLIAFWTDKIWASIGKAFFPYLESK